MMSKAALLLFKENDFTKAVVHIHLYAVGVSGFLGEPSPGSVVGPLFSLVEDFMWEVLFD